MLNTKIISKKVIKAINNVHSCADGHIAYNVNLKFLSFTCKLFFVVMP